MKKPTAYLDTTIISAYWYDGADVLALARRLRTRDWWEMERLSFSIWISNVTEAELRDGVFPRQKECVKMARRLHYLPITRAAEDMQEQILAEGVIPANKPRDALQMAVCVAHEIDYLLSWNYAHLANPNVQTRLVTICKKFRLRAPLLVSPETIPKARFSQEIRRPKHDRGRNR